MPINRARLATALAVGDALPGARSIRRAVHSSRTVVARAVTVTTMWDAIVERAGRRRRRRPALPGPPRVPGRHHGRRRVAGHPRVPVSRQGVHLVHVRQPPVRRNRRRQRRRLPARNGDRRPRLRKTARAGCGSTLRRALLIEGCLLLAFAVLWVVIGHPAGHAARTLALLVVGATAMGFHAAIALA